MIIMANVLSITHLAQLKLNLQRPALDTTNILLTQFCQGKSPPPPKKNLSHSQQACYNLIMSSNFIVTLKQIITQFLPSSLL